MKIMKFGGSSLRDGTGIAQVAKIIAEADGSRVIVASALQGVTDLLHDTVPRVLQDEAQVATVLKELRQRHESVLDAVAPDDAPARHALDAHFERLERLLYGIVYTQEDTERLRDNVQSYGERLSTPILAAAIRALGKSAIALDAEHVGLHTLGPYGSARPDLPALGDAVPRTLGPYLETGQIPVITGYYGVNPQGHPTLFGRGGSDFVASLIAVAMDADVVELWKDVPGFLTTDPHAIADAQLVPELGYDEAAELAYFGAKVLHPRAVEPVGPKGIPIHIRSVHDPNAPGSSICGDVAPAAGRVRAAACKDGLAILRLNGPGMAYRPGIAKRVFDALHDADINVINLSTSQATFALLLEDGDAERAEQTLRPLVGGHIQGIELMRNRSLVCVVGRGLGETPGSAARILAAVSQQGVNVEMISLGASDIAIDFIVKSESRMQALKGVHDAFVVRA